MQQTTRARRRVIDAAAQHATGPAARARPGASNAPQTDMRQGSTSTHRLSLQSRARATARHGTAACSAPIAHRTRSCAPHRLEHAACSTRWTKEAHPSSLQAPRSGRSQCHLPADSVGASLRTQSPRQPARACHRKRARRPAAAAAPPPPLPLRRVNRSEAPTACRASAAPTSPSVSTSSAGVSQRAPPSVRADRRWRVLESRRRRACAATACSAHGNQNQDKSDEASQEQLQVGRALEQLARGIAPPNDSGTGPHRCAYQRALTSAHERSRATANRRR